eukprot:175020_1
MAQDRRGTGFVIFICETIIPVSVIIAFHLSTHVWGSERYWAVHVIDISNLFLSWVYAQSYTHTLHLWHCSVATSSILVALYHVRYFKTFMDGTGCMHDSLAPDCS